MADTAKANHPHGMEPYDVGGNGDLGALSNEQQDKLNKFKVKTRTENEKFLRKHPEVECLIGGFLRQLLISQPDNIREFAAEHFTNPNLPADVERQLEDRQRLLRQNKVLQKL